MENLLITPVVHWKNKQTNKEKTIQNLKWSTALCLGLLSDCSYNRSLGSEQPQKPASFRRSPSDWVCLVRRPHSKSVASAAEVLVVSAPQPPQCRSLRGHCRRRPPCEAPQLAHELKNSSSSLGFSRLSPVWAAATCYLWCWFMEFQDPKFPEWLFSRPQRAGQL